MLRTTTLAAFIIGLSGTGTAQVITEANVIPPTGTYQMMYTFLGDPTGPVDTVGTGIIWDITDYNWQEGEPFTYSVGPAAASPYAEYAPGANVHVEDQLMGEPYGQFFYRVDADTLMLLGGLSDLPGWPIVFEPECEGLLMTFPATIGTEMVLDVPTWCVVIYDTDHVARRVMALGELVTPMGTFPDVVLIRTTRCGENWVDPETGGGYACTKTFAWYQLGNLLYPLMQMFTMANGDDLFSATVYMPLGGTGINEVAASGISLFPNPATDWITLAHDQGGPLGHVAVFAADGRMVQDHGRHATARAVLDLEVLLPGMYQVAIHNNDGRSVHRFVKQ